MTKPFMLVHRHPFLRQYQWRFCAVQDAEVMTSHWGTLTYLVPSQDWVIEAQGHQGTGKTLDDALISLAGIESHD